MTAAKHQTSGAGSAGGGRGRDDERRPISIAAVIDVVGALATGALHRNLYLYDTGKAAGSTGHGTEQLRTVVRAGDQLLWSAIPLECEAYLAIDAVEIDPSVCEPIRKIYPGTDISYWTGTVKKDAIPATPYRIAFLLGSRTEPMVTELSPLLAWER